jgi:transketolase
MQSSIDILAFKANQIRTQVLEMVIRNGGHIASSFSCVEILVSLYYDGFLKVRPERPTWPIRDRFILSKGHAETVYYAILADRGFFPADWLSCNYRQGDCRLGGHPDRSIPGVEVSTGSLGHGLGLAAGISFAAKLDAKDHNQFVLLGDAECTEGAVWEAALFAAKHQLNHLIAIVDRNHIGSIDYTANYTQLEPMCDKWQAFGWHVLSCDGHSFSELRHALTAACHPENKKPRVIIAETVKGKGIDFMENDPIWHVKALVDKGEIASARKQLNEKFAHDAN